MSNFDFYLSNFNIFNEFDVLYFKYKKIIKKLIQVDQVGFEFSIFNPGQI